MMLRQPPSRQLSTTGHGNFVYHRHPRRQQRPPSRASTGNRHTRDKEAGLHRRLLGEPRRRSSPSSTMLGQRVALVTDPTQDRTDRSGRTLSVPRPRGRDGTTRSKQPARERRTAYVYGGGVLLAVTPRSRRPRPRRETLSVGCGVRPATATRRQFRDRETEERRRTSDPLRSRPRHPLSWWRAESLLKPIAELQPSC